MQSPASHTVVVGLGYGDEGKGASVDYLSESQGYTDVVRYNGGAQAAHHVQRAGHVHCFAQVGAAAMQPGRHTYLSRFVVVEPLGLEREFEALRAAGILGVRERQHIDTRATLTTPYHRALNRIRECARGESRHGSCGLGIGIAHLDRVYQRAPGVVVRDVLRDEDVLRHRLEQVRLSMFDRAMQVIDEQAQPRDATQRAEIEVLRDGALSGDLARRYREILCDPHTMIDEEGCALHRAVRERGVLFEGAQGIALDPDVGFFPHVTATRTTPHQAWGLIEEAGSTRPVFTLGVCRAYGTRHGAGPFPGEQEALTRALPDLHNARGEWQGAWRVGWFDEALCRYAIANCEGRLDAIALTCLDRLAGCDTLHTVTRHHADGSYALRSHTPWAKTFEEGIRRLSAPARAYVEAIGEVAQLPIAHIATGPTSQDRATSW